MEWFQLFSIDLGSPDFVLSKESERGTWISLLAYCCAQENGGIIAGARAWPRDAWLQIPRVQWRSVSGDSRLWHWDGDSLVVKFYPKKSEAKYLANRENGRIGGIRSAEARRNQKGSAGSTGASSDASTGASSETAPGSNLGFDFAATDKSRVDKTIPEEEGEGPASASASSEPNKRKPKNPTPDECPEPLRSRMLQIGSLLHRKPTTPWKAAELEELRNQRLDQVSDAEFAEDIAALESYYTLPLEPAEDFRRRELITFLRHWPDDVNKARIRSREWRVKHDPDGLGDPS